MNLRATCLRFLGTFLVAMVALPAHASVITYTGNNTIGSTTVVNATTPFTASRFVGVSGGVYSFDMPGTSERGFLQVRVNGVWQTIASTATEASGRVALPVAFTPADFGIGIVDAIRLRRQSTFGSNLNDSIGSCNFFGGCYRGMNGVSFQFAIASEPGITVLFAFGLTGLLLASRRRRA